jgi:hypothetical protein
MIRSVDKPAGISLADVVATKSAGEAIHRDLRERPLNERQSRFLRYVRRNYRDGVFYASAATVAGVLGCARSTVQADIREIEARRLWEVIPHALASGHTSNAIIFAAGTLHALRKMEAEEIDWRRTSRVKRDLEKRPDYIANPTNRREDTKYPEDAKRLQSQHFTSLPISKITNTQHGARQGSVSEKRRDAAAGDFEKGNDDEALRTLVAQENLAECDMRTTAMMEKNAIVAGAASRMAALLVTEGLSPSQAHKIARNFDAARIAANLALRAHVGKRNPGGYLAESIRKDYAASAIKLGSDAALAREREKPISKTVKAPVRDTVMKPEPIAHTPTTVRESTPTPTVTAESLDDASALLDALTEPEKAALRERAIADLDKRNAWMGASWKHEGSIFEGCVRGRMLLLVGARPVWAS